VAEPSTVARPYAEAVFKLADGEGKLANWSAMLGALGQISEDQRVQEAMGDPNTSAPKIAGLFISILAGKLSAEAENFVKVLAENRRLALLPEIHLQFEVLRNVREGVVDVDIASAFELTAEQLADLVRRLESKTGRKVKPRLSIDKELIGGVMVAIGDKVIDASARAHLAALANALKN